MNDMKLIETIDIDELLVHGGVFSKIQAVQTQPFEWLTSDFALQLDNAYYLEHSGDKRISPYVRRLLKLQETEKISDYLLSIANNIIQRYSDKWSKIYSAYINSEYNPLENYNMEQTETPNVTHDVTESKKTKIEQTTDVVESNVNTYGFNSVTPVPQSSADGQTKITTEGSDNDNASHRVESETGTRDLTRHGNIGVTTSQQMLESELELRKFKFIDMLMNDVDDIMCLSIY